MLVSVIQQAHGANRDFSVITLEVDYAPPVWRFESKLLTREFTE